MRSIFGILAGTVLSGTAAAAAPSYQFSFHMLIEAGAPVVVNADVSAGSARSIEVSPGLRLEIKVPSIVAQDAPIVVRLVRDAEGHTSTIFEGRSVNAMPLQRALIYKVCNKVTSFAEELPKDGLRCQPAADGANAPAD